jgi:flotillin
MLRPLLSQAANLGPVIVAVVGIVVIVFVLLAIWAGRYTKVGPNQVLVVSGRALRHEAPDGTVSMRGYRIIKGGGTFVLPVIERADVLSLEVVTVDLNLANARTNKGALVPVEAVAQVKIKGDDMSIARAIELFLGGGTEQIKKVAAQTLQNHLRSLLGMMSAEDWQNRSALAAKLQEAAAEDMSKMGLAILSFSITDLGPLAIAEPPKAFDHS